MRSSSQTFSLTATGLVACMLAPLHASETAPSNWQLPDNFTGNLVWAQPAKVTSSVGGLPDVTTPVTVGWDIGRDLEKLVPRPAPTPVPPVDLTRILVDHNQDQSPCGKTKGAACLSSPPR